MPSSEAAAAADEDYCRDYLPPSLVEKLEAGAFRQLCRHLQERSDAVPNMELMTLSGFCRNCLAKVCYGRFNDTASKKVSY